MTFSLPSDILDMIFLPSLNIVVSRGVKYLNNFTLFKYNINLLLLLDYISEEKTVLFTP